MRVISKNAFFQKIGYAPHPQQALYHASKARFRAANCGRRFGKDLALDTVIVAVEGLTTMGEVPIGWHVYGPDGLPTEIVAKSEVLYNDCYRVTFDDGTYLIAGAGHEWAIETYTMRKSRGNGRWNVAPYKVMTTAELAKRKPKYPDSIALTLPVDMPEADVAVDPYVWGVWLGDGTAGQAQLTAHEDDMPTYLREFERVGYSLRSIPSKKYGWKIVGLTKSDCLVKQAEEYKLSSAEQRLALLQGLMDTDGTISNEQLQFDNKNYALVELVAYLVNSLGGKGKIYTQVKNGETYYRFGFNIATPVFRLARKQIKQAALRQGAQTQRRYIKSVERVDTVPTQCIQVAREDGLWLAGSEFIVTHNSTMAARDREPSLFVPNTLGWIVGPTYDLGEKEFRVIWQDLIIRQQLGKDKTIKRAYNKKQGNMYIEFPWGSRVEVRSADHPELLVGDALDWVIMSEAAKHDVETWERFIRPSLADKKGGADFPTTPEGFNWMYDIWMLGQDKELEEYESWRFPSWANPHVYPEGENDPEIKLLRRTMRPETFLQEIAADFSSFVGKIYPEWDITKHVTNVKFNPNWPNYIAFDWGYTNPLAAIEFQVSPNDEVFVWREHYQPYTRVEEHCRILKNREQPDGYHLDMAFGDAADPEAAETVSQYLVPCVAMSEAKENWRDGIDLVRSFMERESGEDEFGGPLYESAFHVDFSCANMIREFNNYKAPQAVKGRNVQEIGIKQDDHTLDAVRYGLVHIFKLGATHHLADLAHINKAEQNQTYDLVTATGPTSFGNTDTAGFFTQGGTF